MDYSTISNKTNCTVTEEIPDFEMKEQYYSLKKQYDNLAITFEATKQELYDTTRSYNTALDVQRHIAAELESHQANEEKRKNELTCRISSLQEEISALREERTETAERHANENKNFEDVIRRLKEEIALKPDRASPERDCNELDEIRASLATALDDTAKAKAALDDARQEIASWRLKAEELVSEMGEIRLAAELRREEVQSANEREAAALADLAEARAMLHQCTDSPELQAHAPKGNSIFAEVEDKRQEMAKTLIQMKQTNARLRRDLANKQSEVDALLHEKNTIWEQQAGAAAHYDKELMDSYEERITQLENLCERQRRELARWFGKLCDPTAQGWLPGVLEHFKIECERLREEVLTRGAAQLACEAQIRDLRRKIAHLTTNTKSVSPSNDNKFKDIDNNDITITRLPVMKNKPTPDDVKKKVSFN